MGSEAEAGLPILFHDAPEMADAFEGFAKRINWEVNAL